MLLQKRTVAVVIPAYNEAFIINEVVTSVQQALEQAEIAHEVLVIDDGSTDDTARLAEAAGAHVLRHLYNTGCGGATATGLRYAKRHNFEISATFDADGQHCPNDLVLGIYAQRRNHADLLIGSRLINSAGMPLVKVLGNKWLSLITYYLFGIQVTDSQSGLRIFSHNALHRLTWKTYGYGFSSELLWRAKQKKLIIGEFPIKAVYTDYSIQKGQNNWNSIIIIQSLIKWRILELFNE